MNSIWNDVKKEISFPMLKENISTKVLIIGGGIAGLLCAYKLYKRGIDYILVEGREIGSGITSKTTAVITAQHDLLYQDIIKQHGDSVARDYLYSNIEAVNELKNIASEFDCDLENISTIIYSDNNSELIRNEARAIESLGYDINLLYTLPFKSDIAGAIEFSNMGQFHPLKFIYQISAKLNIYEHTFVRKLMKNKAITDYGTITADKIIITTHYPSLKFSGWYNFKLYQKKSYVIVFKKTLLIKNSIMNIKEDGIYLRRYKDYLIIGGGDIRTGEKGDGFSKIRTFARKYFPGSIEVMSWINQDCVSLDGMPYIGPYDKSNSNLLVASGFNLWGMSTSMMAANILADLCVNKKNYLSTVFSPNRSILSKQLFKNIGQTIVSFINPSMKRCSHLGCSLVWNDDNQTWECPCHGSSFNKNGLLIENPAMKNTKL